MFDIIKYQEIEKDLKSFRDKYNLSKKDIESIEGCSPEYLVSSLNKKCLIALFKEGVLTDHSNCGDSYWSGITIVDYDEDYVFGYYYYNDDKDCHKYFRLKIRQTVGDNPFYYFVREGSIHNLDDFMKIGL